MIGDLSITISSSPSSSSSLITSSKALDARLNFSPEKALGNLVLTLVVVSEVSEALSMDLSLPGLEGTEFE